MRWLFAFWLALAGFSSTQAYAFTINCRDVGVVGGTVEGVSRTWQSARMLGGAFSERRRNTDAWQLLVHSSRKPSFQSDMLTAWAAMMCLAREGDGGATRLQTRWSEAIGRETDGFRIPRAMDYFLDRVKNAAQDTRQLLSPAERQLIADTIGYLAVKRGGEHRQIQDGLTLRFNLPRASQPL